MGSEDQGCAQGMWAPTSGRERRGGVTPVLVAAASFMTSVKRFCYVKPESE